MESLSIGHEVLHILLVLHLIQHLSTFVVVAGDWPGGLVLLLSLDQPIQGALFPTRLHEYFKSSNYSVTCWRSVVEFQGAKVGLNNVVNIISGGIDFLRRVLLMLDGCQCFIVMIEVVWHGASWYALQCAIRDGHSLFEKFSLHPLVVAMLLQVVLWMPNISSGLGWICHRPIFPRLIFVFIIPSGSF